MSIEAMKQALEGKSLYDITGSITDIDKCIIHRFDLIQAIKAITTEESSATQEPVAWINEETKTIYWHNTHETDDYHGFKRTTPLYTHPQPKADHIPDATKMVEQEPVAWMRTSGTGSPVVTEALLVEMPEMRWNFQKPLYTHPQPKAEQPKVRTGDCLLVGVCASEGHKIQPKAEQEPKREWVGLTDEETAELVHRYAFYNLAREIEAKLKEKNKIIQTYSEKDKS